MRIAALLASVFASLTFGLAAPASGAAPTVSVVSKCGYLEVTIESTIATYADFSFYADAGAVNNVPVKVGTNVFKLYANGGESGLIDIRSGGDGFDKFGMDYRRPDGCKQAVLRFEYVHVCGGKSLVKVNNVGDAPADHLYLYRAYGPVTDIKRHAITSDVAVPVGASYLLADNLADPYLGVMIDWGVDAGFLWPGRPAVRGYVAPSGCQGTPTVSFAASCGSVDIKSVPADSPLTAIVLREPPVVAESRNVELAKGEAVLVKLANTAVGAYIHQAACESSPTQSATAAPYLPKTGTPTGIVLLSALALLAIGGMATLLGLRRRHV